MNLQTLCAGASTYYGGGASSPPDPEPTEGPWSIWMGEVPGPSTTDEDVDVVLATKWECNEPFHLVGFRWYPVQVGESFSLPPEFAIYGEDEEIIYLFDGVWDGPFPTEEAWFDIPLDDPFPMDAGTYYVAALVGTGTNYRYFANFTPPSAYEPVFATQGCFAVSSVMTFPDINWTSLYGLDVSVMTFA